MWLLAITRSKAKMWEYGLPLAEHIEVPQDPSKLLRLAVGILGDVSAAVARGDEAAATEDGAALPFSARYFDAYLSSRMAPALDTRLRLLAAAAYFLSDRPGTASVLTADIPSFGPPEGHDLDALLVWLLAGARLPVLEVRGRYKAAIDRLQGAMVDLYEMRGDSDALAPAIALLRGTAYDEGSAHELLIADVTCAVALMRSRAAAVSCLPAYSDLPAGAWAPTLVKPSFMRDLWPAQRRLGAAGVFAGASAIVQMPTSAGKSRATELVIRSSFLSDRSSLAVVVAPFRALCHEIHDSLARAFRDESVNIQELSDVFQDDFELSEIMGKKSVVVVTPEKLVYVLRHVPELGGRIGLVVFDEGHQFDSGTRGITYELLLTSLKELVSANAQRILISAVLSNGAAIGTWLNGETGQVVSATDLLPTERSVAFASWRSPMGQLHFVDPSDPDKDEFFVPRIIRRHDLVLRPRETKPRAFPEKKDPASVAMYLGLMLAPKGAVAIFCGTKSTATGLCDTLADALQRGLNMPVPAEFSNLLEVQLLTDLYQRNLGKDSTACEAARRGVFTHHNNTPHGVRLAVEHAMKEGQARLVVCTSTLAQGVNLPIRYLIVTTSRQGGSEIRVRDFHNLMGRAGRSGMHTEGSVLFANAEVFDNKGTRKTDWPAFTRLLRVENSEPCASSLLALVEPLKNRTRTLELRTDPLEILGWHLADQDGRESWIEVQSEALSQQWFTVETLRDQLFLRARGFAAIESFLLAHWPIADESDGATVAEHLAKQTLGYHLASEEQRLQLVEVFRRVAAHVAARVPDAARRGVLGRTLFGVAEAEALAAWVAEHAATLSACASEEDVFTALWPCVSERIRNDKFRKWTPSTAVQPIVRGWLAGQSFGELHERALESGVRLGTGPKPRKPKVEHLVEFGENALGFDGAHVLGAIVDVCALLPSGTAQPPIVLMQGLQKRLKYGLPSKASVCMYELGFADRPLSIQLGRLAPGASSQVEAAVALRALPEAATAVVSTYPQYFSLVLERVLGN
jgi:POLQ-like helicase